MVVGVGGVAVGAEPGARGARPAAARGGRRDLLRGLLAAAGAVALAPVVAASRPSSDVRGGDAPGELAFDETYRGRHIRGVVGTDGRTGEAEWHVTVDGVRLHLMRRADGTWLTMIDHYRSYATPLEAARAAVDELGPGQRLRDSGSTHTGDHHGVHA
ncbi:hypothetical protein Stsp02_12000 [Streptomyces sp. NBRC 14336]|uniref:tyrosinase family oxidase copper chaperone n=1 Tax=Streptomyces sp. NBRC 14336 TaxID=3030992 RepID=UPI0024A19A59|nr:tyrosinase family oxidase copper chaperone [Streptomyces sp. NBRC 14336]WBO78077.1 tyrosinase cofactor [Streptomyces sp. SBE_14.2]GLW45538.1 hypothetical protein Stsp02_12000 [Streptomyces sp. NBRC 14336]